MNAYKELIFWQMSRFASRRKVAVRIAGRIKDRIAVGIMSRGSNSIAKKEKPEHKYRLKNIEDIIDEAHLLSKDKIERLLELSKEQPVIFSSDSEDVISSEEMDKENIKKLENQTDIKVFRLTNRIRTNAELSTFIQNMMHLPPRKNSRGYPHIFVVYANDDVEAENLLSDYIKQGYQWVEIEESERQEDAGRILKMQAVRDMDKIVLLLDERYYYDEEGYAKGSLFYEKWKFICKKDFSQVESCKGKYSFGSKE